jgi:hypothetical protein
MRFSQGTCTNVLMDCIRQPVGIARSYRVKAYMRRLLMLCIGIISQTALKSLRSHASPSFIHSPRCRPQKIQAMLARRPVLSRQRGDGFSDFNALATFVGARRVSYHYLYHI